MELAKVSPGVENGSPGPYLSLVFLPNSELKKLVPSGFLDAFVLFCPKEFTSQSGPQAQTSS